MRIIALTGAAVLAVMAPAAYAAPTIHFDGGSGTTAAGTTVFQNFDSYAPGTLLGTKTYAFDANSSLGVRPAFGSTGNFASVVGGGTYTVNFAATNILSFVLGSLDSFNKLTLLFADNSSVTYLGNQIIGGLPYISGDQHSPLSNGVVTYNANGGPLTVGATFSTRSNSFEIDNLARGGVPEPATWALMILGFGAVGGAVRYRRRATVRA